MSDITVGTRWACGDVSKHPGTYIVIGVTFEKVVYQSEQTGVVFNKTKEWWKANMIQKEA